MADQVTQSETKVNNAERILSNFTNDQKADLVIHSFVTSAGAMDAQGVHGWWLGDKYGISAEEALEMVKIAAMTCGEEGKQKILQGAGIIHADVMKDTVNRAIGHLDSMGKPVGNKKDVLWNEVVNQIPTQFSFRSPNESEDFAAKLRAVELDVDNPDFSLTAPNLGKLRKVLAQAGYYNGKEWYKALPATHPLMEKE